MKNLTLKELEELVIGTNKTKYTKETLERELEEVEYYIDSAHSRQTEDKFSHIKKFLMIEIEIIKGEAFKKDLEELIKERSEKIKQQRQEFKDIIGYKSINDPLVKQWTSSKNVARKQLKHLNIILKELYTQKEENRQKRNW